ncbi:TPA: site-specific DNA-methyltransferase [Vibrio vulnificus]|nr:site-specific DNA-methyltransferase [Vibrio vulnificus]
MEKIASDSPESKSLDITAQNIEQLKALFPDVFSENKIDFEALKAVLGESIDDSQERYNFTWNGKSKARQIAQTPSTGTLRPCKEESVNWDTTENLFIEGDNLEVLKLLQKSYHKKVKMIYIDPPYNTGKDFVYKDNYHNNLHNYLELTGQIDSDNNKLSTNSDTSGRYHSDWLSMIYPRLKLARNLLVDDGVIFISIDEVELNNLAKLCDEIFGEDNFVECICWNKRIPKNDGEIGNIHEYILIYRKSRFSEIKFTQKKDGIDDIVDLLNKAKQALKPIDIVQKELRELYKNNSYDRGITLYNSVSSDYRVWGKINVSWPNANTIGPDYDVLHPTLGIPVARPDRGWRWKKETFDSLVDYQNIIELPDGSYMCGQIWFDSKPTTQPSLVKYLDEVDSILLKSVLSFKSDGGMEVERIFGEKNVFSYPKPTNLIKLLINSIPMKSGDIVLDFFAGSGTTAHSVVSINQELSKDLRFICVQLPEVLDDGHIGKMKFGCDNLADLSFLRIKKVINEPKFSSVGVKKFKLSETNIRPWESDFDNLEHSLLSANESIKIDRTTEDVLYEILLKYGIELTVPVEQQTVNNKQVYVVGEGALLVCLDDNITSEVVEGIAELKHELDPETTQVVFKDAGFADSVVKTNAIQILKQAGIDDVKSI